MKRIITITTAIFFLFTTLTLFALEEKKTTETKTIETSKQETKTPDEPINSLFGGKINKHGGYGAPVFRMTKFGSEYEAMVGAKGGWIINHNFSLGLAGYGVAGTLNKNIYNDEEGIIKDEKIGVGYGGLMLEYFIAPKSLVNFSFGALVGVGGIGYGHKKKNIDDCNCDDYDHDDEYDGKGAGFFIFEPEINMHVNITRFFKVGVGVSYRFVAGLNYKGITNKEIGGPAAQVVLSFGWF